MAGENIAVAVHHPLHHIGGVEVAAVDAGGLGGNKGNGGGIEVLPESVAGQVQLRGGLLGGEDAQGLTVQVDATAVYEAEALHIIIELLRAQAQAVGDEGGVTGVTRRLLQGLVAVAAPVAAVDGGIQHMDGAGAVEGGILVDNPLLQSRRQGQDLEGGAGLIGIVDGLVAPLAQLGVRQVQLLLRHQLGDGGIINGRRVVQVVAGAGGHGQNRAGLHIHDNARGAVGGLGGGDHLIDGLFHIILNGGVQGQDDVAAVLRLIILFVAIEHIVARRVLGRHHQARLPLQGAVIPGLQAVEAGIIRTYEADDLRGQGGIGIVALGIGGHVDPHHALIVDVAANLVGYILLYAHFQHLVLGVGALHFLEDALLIDLQNFREPLGHAVLGPGDGGILVV